MNFCIICQLLNPGFKVLHFLITCEYSSIYHTCISVKRLQLLSYFNHIFVISYLYCWDGLWAIQQLCSIHKLWHISHNKIMEESTHQCFQYSTIVSTPGLVPCLSWFFFLIRKFCFFPCAKYSPQKLKSTCFFPPFLCVWSVFCKFHCFPLNLNNW